jgi:hypothetical protein
MLLLLLLLLLLECAMCKQADGEQTDTWLVMHCWCAANCCKDKDANCTKRVQADAAAAAATAGDPQG